MDLDLPLADILGANGARILRRLGLVGTPLSMRRIAELTSVPIASASRELARFQRIGLVTRNDSGGASLWTLNRDHAFWGPLQDILATPQRIEQAIRSISSEMLTDNTTVALYGSFVRGEGTSESDIDVLVIWGTRSAEDEREMILTTIRDRISTLTGNSVDIIAFDPADIHDLVEANDPLVNSWLADARTVAGMTVPERIGMAKA
ncbi:nucleotidyltransferase domain-containing protein [Paramicrobacterium fandaimingii]|uniref:nucleotidyltransferase domain-containing protein n=1 Tax=Paramicrobacterium fandaimingii TaxID=2708079 RepID=UPI001423269A|nr:nucleotidyltransferase domain-containing protein [Microbacterium fandaimingii]